MRAYLWFLVCSTISNGVVLGLGLDAATGSAHISVGAVALAVGIALMLHSAATTLNPHRGN